ncbi:MAG: hypothetical protein RR313_04760 [Anaerovoracaceae bacterium]
MNFSQLLIELGIEKTEIMNQFNGKKAPLERLLFKFPEGKIFGDFYLAYHENRLDDLTDSVVSLQKISCKLGFKTLYDFCSKMLLDFSDEPKKLHDDFSNICLEYEHLALCINTYLGKSTETPVEFTLIKETFLD